MCTDPGFRDRQKKALPPAVYCDQTRAGFLIAGVTMMITPGPGILFLLLGLSLVNLPGKRQLELRLLRVGGVKRKIDELRRKHHRPILQIPPK